MKQYIKIIKLISKYNNLSKDTKATIWYTINNVFQKVAPWLIMVILTHNVSLTRSDATIMNKDVLPCFFGA